MLKHEPLHIPTAEDAMADLVDLGQQFGLVVDTNPGDVLRELKREIEVLRSRCRDLAAGLDLERDERRADATKYVALVDAARAVDAEELCSCPIMENGQPSPSCKMVVLRQRLRELDANEAI